MTETLNQPLGGNQMPRFGGPATMMRLPTQVGTDGLDACFVGIPMDIGASNRAGTRYGPRQIRAESCLIRPYNMATRAAPFDSLMVADIGDVAIDTFNLPKCMDIITDAYRAIIAKGCRPLTLGGDHTLTYPILRAIAGEIRTCRPRPCRCPCRHQREHVRREDRPRHAVPSRGRGQAARHRTLHPDRTPRPRAMRRMISTGRASRAFASSRPRNAGTNRSPLSWRRCAGKWARARFI